MKYIPLYLLTTAAIYGMTFTPTAFAADSGPVLEEVMVTAQYREQGLQDVPISMSAVDSSVIEKVNIVKIEDLTTLVPNFTYAESGISTNFYIRGVGSGVNQGFEQSVGVYVDGVHYPRGQQVRAPFLDLERVEVLRGPQSILFGKNAVAGAMNITTAKPTNELVANLLLSREFEDGETIAEGALSGPFSDRVRGRVAFRYRDADGYVENITLNRSEPSREETTVRGILEADINENITVTFKVENSSFDALGRNLEVVNALPVSNTASPFVGLTYGQILAGVFGQDPSVLNQTQDGIRSSNGDSSFNDMSTYQLDLDWNIGEFDLKSITAFEDLTYDEVCDCDFTGANIFTAQLHEQYEQFSQEFRLTSPLGERSDYILGVYYQNSDHSYADEIIVEANSILIPALGASGALLTNSQAARIAQVDASVMSVFGQYNWHINDAMTLQLGGRYTSDDRDGSRTMNIQAVGGGALPAAQAAAAVVYAGGFGITSNNLAALADLGDPTSTFLIGQLGEPTVSGNRDISKFSPDVKFSWAVNDDTLLYASWARGFKSGGFDFRANNKGQSATSADAFEFQDEIATNFEFGGKFKLGQAAELNATAFFTQFDDLQISIFDGILGFNVGNAATADIKGIEFDGRWALTDNVRLTGGLAFLDFEFTDFKNGQCYGGQTPDFANGQCDYTGLANQLVADTNGNLAIDFDYAVMDGYEITGLASIFYTSAYDSAQTHDPVGRQEAYSKYNLRIGFGPQDGPWDIALLGKNLSDEKVKTYNGDVPLAGSSFGTKANYTFFSQGRTLALQYRYKL